MANQSCSRYSGLLHETTGGDNKRPRLPHVPWLRREAGVLRFDGGRFQPRLHDLRHTFAVTRLSTWVLVVAKGKTYNVSFRMSPSISGT